MNENTESLISEVLNTDGKIFEDQKEMKNESPEVELYKRDSEAHLMKRQESEDNTT